MLLLVLHKKKRTSYAQDRGVVHRKVTTWKRNRFFSTPVIKCFNYSVHSANAETASTPHAANICVMQISIKFMKIRLLHETMFSIYLPTLQKMDANCVFECISAPQTQAGRNVYTFLSRTVCRKNNSQRVTLTFSHVSVCRIFGTFGPSRFTV